MSFTVADAVQVICDKLNDPNKESEEGNAYNALNQSLNDLMYEKKYKIEDVHGLVDASSASADESGLNVNTMAESKLFRLEHVFADPESAEADSKVIKQVSLDYFNGLQGKYGFIDDDTVLTYRVGDTLRFYPASQASGIKVKVVFTQYPDTFASSASSTNLLTSFSKNFVYQAIDLAVKRILQERGIE